MQLDPRRDLAASALLGVTVPLGLLGADAVLLGEDDEGGVRGAVGEDRVLHCGQLF